MTHRQLMLCLLSKPSNQVRLIFSYVTSVFVLTFFR
ncbi:hypothetical protein VEx25_1847 [Vibrio antiquarius]|uniref:Uncharacterized protein n=1 Tax=Vibrio antiquarius (strain Ex25) TaxID=150340 RepID=A0ABM9WXV2_VIBAE|nr:hypothetical protein VEx25_1847 [Vibrio antiquarius]